MKVNFMYGIHKKLWGILSEWGAEDVPEKKLCVKSEAKRIETIEKLGFSNGHTLYDDPPCRCVSKLIFGVYPGKFTSCQFVCPLEWSDENGNHLEWCISLHRRWRLARGEEKKKLARLIRDAPLRKDTQIFYNIVE